MDGEITFLGDMQRLALQDGDTLVLTVNAPVSWEAEARMIEHVRSRVGSNVNVLILGDGMTAGVLSPNRETP